jgi:ADP-heptose:LPS heptosyltransferase
LGKFARPILIVNAVAQPSIRQREYPLQQMALVLEELLAREIVETVVLVGDSYSRSCHGPLSKVIGPRGLDLSGELSLTATAALVRECDAALTIDGGLLHAALASTLPVVALYGPTEIYSADPRGIAGRYANISAFDNCRCFCPSHRSIRVSPECRDQSKCLASIPPARIVEAVATLLGQKPAFLKRAGNAGIGPKAALSR